MPMPYDVGVIDLLIGFPSRYARRHYDYLRKLTKDVESQAADLPAEYMFKQVPNYLPEGADPIDSALQKKDLCGVAIGMLGNPEGAQCQWALRDHPQRFVSSLEIDPNDITGTVRKIRESKERYDIEAVTSFPADCNPPVPVDDRRYYPVYETCIDLDIPIALKAGIVGPRLPSKVQHVLLFGQVCYDFPELRIVMRHGAEPWEALAVKLMLKWAGLRYTTSAFAPKYYPQAIIDYANTRGADKVIYAGYYPMGLSLRRIFDELPSLPLKDEVWPKFLRENAVPVFKIDV